MDSQNTNNFQFTVPYESSFFGPAERKTSSTPQIWVCRKVKGQSVQGKPAHCFYSVPNPQGLLQNSPPDKKLQRSRGTRVHSKKPLSLLSPQRSFLSAKYSITQDNHTALSAPQHPSKKRGGCLLHRQLLWHISRGLWSSSYKEISSVPGEESQSLELQSKHQLL